MRDIRVARHRADGHALAVGLDAGAVVVHRDHSLPLRSVDTTAHRDCRRLPGADAGFGGVANEVPEHLPQQHLVALYLSEVTAHMNRRALR